ncbi:SPRY domain containing protein [Entamoeba histolytica HM-1:IMSS-B]|uniref:SPRY domain protein n=6 Tax=Entamoeba histolytica TaxID=5759 RepID=C4M6N2_ENTH1|nr:SPRY domain protein [Entamoeba histolytica HM-1:IMSS]EMD48835.1 SPRY domain containing protein [Entamoeba histolytica KU27]EMH76051.1 SPRY domain containing protein [Entamoeba histolytica HM-1:IMSS-B]EMS16740.1 SPRY domain containing protein [Entamoeba histolytica HM-3:IMSS]ENY64594.1 SPRY domain containing protein [Entamoeba histolytica HM-1:IMSS-A]GAT97152.1 spry domain protein [Entamoeba histolytica]|eukprot:XP_649302.2 SPRY domain protein [Entamoeba histolytica HM-1:IMSS]
MEKTIKTKLNQIFQKLAPNAEINFDSYEPILLPYYVDALVTSNKQSSEGQKLLLKKYTVAGETKSGFLENEFIFTNAFPSVRTNLGAHSGKYVFQVILQTDGLFQIGIFENSTVFDRTKGIGDFPDSYAYDGYRKCLWNEKQTPFGPKWKKGDVVSICVDFDQRRIKILLNDQDLGIAFESFGTEPMNNYYFGVTASTGEKCIINYGEYPMLYKQQIGDYSPVCQQPIQSSYKECEILGKAIIECLNDISNGSVLILNALFARYIPLIVNSKVLCIEYFLPLLTECTRSNSLGRLGSLLKHMVHPTDLEIIVKTLMEWYYIISTHYQFKDDIVISLTQILLDIISEMMAVACGDPDKLYQFIDIILSKSTTVSKFDYKKMIQGIDLSQPPERLMNDLDLKYKQQLELDKKLLKALETNQLLDDFVNNYSVRHDINKDINSNEDGMELTMRITYALFSMILDETNHFQFNNEFLINTPKEYPDFDRLGGTISYIQKTFPLEKNNESFETNKHMHRAILFFYNNTLPYFFKMELVCRRNIRIISTLENSVDWLNYLWEASLFIIPCRYQIQLEIFKQIVNALVSTKGLLYVHEPYISSIISLCKNLRQNILFNYQKILINENKQLFGDFINTLISFLGNTFIVKPGLKTTMFMSVTYTMAKRIEFIDCVSLENKRILFNFAFESLTSDEEERFRRAITFIRIGMPIPFYVLKKNIAAYPRYRKVFSNLLQEYFSDDKTIMNTHNIVFDYVSKSLDKILLLLDKERLSGQEEKMFESLSSSLIDGTDLMDGLSYLFGKIYIDHTLATKFLQYLSFVLYQCSVRNSITTRRGKQIYSIFCSLRILLLDVLTQILKSIPEEKRLEWLLQDGIITLEINKGLEGIDLSSSSILSFEIEYPTTIWDRWRPTTFTDDIITNLKVEEKHALEGIDNTLKFLKNSLNELNKKHIKKIVITPTFQGRASNNSFEMEVEENEDQLCFICCSNPADTIMLPCKHSACRSCIERHMEHHNECFFCKTKIEGLKKRSEMGMENESATKN